MISLDCETTGIDFWHGARPYLVTTCDANGDQVWWEWDVDPLTRQVEAPLADVLQIKELIESADGIVLQNGKFDAHAIVMLAADFGVKIDWPWDRIHDTMTAGHLLASNRPHNLTDMAIQWLGVDISKHENRLEEIVKECRSIVRREWKDWKIAAKDSEDMPSAKEKSWKYDTWLPKACFINFDDPNPEWETIALAYANPDSATTLALWSVMQQELKRRGLWAIYNEVRSQIKSFWQMERAGVTWSVERMEELREHHGAESTKNKDKMVAIAAKRGFKLTVPAGGNNKSLRECCFSVLKLPRFKYSDKTGEPSLDKEVMDRWEKELEGEQLEFVQALAAKREVDTALTYMAAYERFGLPVGDDVRLLHPNTNMTGTGTLRLSNNNPNGQNIPKKKDDDTGRNVRYCFGPDKDREWWSIDFDNLELRLPAWDAEEREMIELFERANEPPFYGSNHILIFSILWPELWAQALKAHGPEGAAEFVKSTKGYKAKEYQWTKNGNFAVQYGAVPESGTADRAYHQQGAQLKVMARFKNLARLNKATVEFANKHGYVETMPDKKIDPKRGYPLLCSRSEYGKIIPTVPFNYKIQGTACWVARKAVRLCQEQLDKWRATDGFDGKIVLYVHDEIDFDFPKRGDPTEEMAAEKSGKRGIFRKSNLWRARKLKAIMESCGADVGVPTPVSMTWHPNNWLEGKDVH